MSIIANLDQLIRNGQRGKALRIALEIRETGVLNKMERGGKRAISEIFRRLGHPEIAVQVLYPFVRGRGRAMQPSGTPDEELEYGASLIQMGAVDEGTQLLKSGKASDFAKSKLFRAFGHFARWEYEEALPLLEGYLESPSLHPYDYQVGRVNWYAAKVAVGDWQDVLAHIDEFIRETYEAQSKLLSFNLKEIKLQALVLSGMNNEALRFSSSMLNEQEQIGGQEQVWFQRWRLLAECQQRPEPKEIGKLKAFGAQVLRQGLWEIARDCDFHVARLSQDPDLWAKLYFGTRHRAYQKRIQAQAAFLSSSYTRALGAGSIEELFVLSRAIILNTQEGEERELFRIGGLLDIFLRVLCSDFYRPLTLAELYARVYPNQYFSPESSANRIHQLSHRLRRTLRQKSHYPPVIQAAPLWSLQPTSKMGIYYERSGGEFDVGTSSAEWDRWCGFVSNVEWKQGEVLRASDISQRSEKSIRSVHRMLSWAKDNEFVETLGSGPKGSYRLKLGS